MKFGFICAALLAVFLLGVQVEVRADDHDDKKQSASTQSMSAKQAYENMKKDAGVVGNKAKEAYGEAKSAASNLWDKTKKAVSD